MLEESRVDGGEPEKKKTPEDRRGQKKRVREKRGLTSWLDRRRLVPGLAGAAPQVTSQNRPFATLVGGTEPEVGTKAADRKSHHGGEHEKFVACWHFAGVF